MGRTAPKQGGEGLRGWRASQKDLAGHPNICL